MVNKVFVEELFLPIALLHVFVCTAEPWTCCKPRHRPMLRRGNAPRQQPPWVVSAWLERCLGPHLREFEGVFLQFFIAWKMLQSSGQHAIGRKGKRDFLPCLPIFIQKKVVNETCDFLCIIRTTARIPLLSKSICLTILSRSLRNQYLLSKVPQPL